MHPRAKSLLDFIGSLEAPRGYDDYYRGAAFAPPKPLTKMTIEEVLFWQREANPPGPGTAAAGRYQIVDQPNARTLSRLVRKLGIDTEGTLFDAATQDRLGFELLCEAGWHKFYSGAISEFNFGDCLAGVWASLPMLTGPRRGDSRYGGPNSALCSIADFRRAMRGFWGEDGA